MVKLQIDLSEEEDKIIEVYKAEERLKNKESATKQIIRNFIDKQKVMEAIDKIIHLEILKCGKCEGLDVVPEDTLGFELKHDLGLIK